MSHAMDLFDEKPFLWGSATAAYQAEGGWNADGKGESEWDRFSHLSPMNVNHVNADVACDFYHRWREDIDLLAAGGQNSFRFSLSWSRILPAGTGEANPRGIDFYNRVIDHCLERGVEPNVTLFHYDLPVPLAARGGWLNADAADWFASYARVCFEAFGDRVRLWATVNEPRYYAHCGYMVGNFPPNRALDLASYFQALYNLMVGSAKAVALYHELGLPGLIGVVHDNGNVELAPQTERPDEVFAEADFFFNRVVLCPALEGALPPDYDEMTRRFGAVPFRIDGEKDVLAAGKADFLGLNLYNRQYVTHWRGGETSATNNRAPDSRELREGVVIKPLFEQAFDDSVPRNRWGREVLPRVMRTALTEIHERYGAPLILLTENGHGAYETPDELGRIEDDERIAALDGFVRELLAAKKDGVDVRGYYVWSAMDLYSWVNGYDKRYGLVYVDYDHGLARIPKKSWHWYRDLIASRPEGV